jgi:hypothetical protein
MAEFRIKFRMLGFEIFCHLFEAYSMSRQSIPKESHRWNKIKLGRGY